MGTIRRLGAGTCRIRANKGHFVAKYRGPQPSDNQLMTEPDTDPLAVIAMPPPAFSERAASKLARDHYGLNATLSALNSERDQNFRVDCEDGRQFVLKIGNAAEDSRVTDFQINALLHIEEQSKKHSLAINVPRVVRTRKGAPRVLLDSGDASHVVRLVTYVEGRLLDETPRSPKLCRNLGRYLAILGQSLRGFGHPGEDQSLLWDMKCATELRRLLEFIDDRSVRACVASSIDSFEEIALPAFGTMRWQVIHNDFHPENILIDAAAPDQVAGVIDFGDMLRSPLIVDVGVATSYLRVPEGDPLQQIAEFVSGYHEITPFEAGELDILLCLAKVRLAATICILHWRASERGIEDAYLQNSWSEGLSAEAFLYRLHRLSPDRTMSTLMAGCQA